MAEAATASQGRSKRSREGKIAELEFALGNLDCGISIRGEDGNGSNHSLRRTKRRLRGKIARLEGMDRPLTSKEIADRKAAAAEALAERNRKRSAEAKARIGRKISEAHKKAAEEKRDGRVCTRCERRQDIENFKFKTGGKSMISRRSTWCRDCTRDHQRQRYHARKAAAATS
jgi:hypothetical protein